ncbi:hypothetical protein C8J57DRAFT_1451541 [Mycena rebaudengoi]|nr:hypothetical protein C8J57DRAFT_1451541 [Mycena rebaudengoi]
MDPSKPIIFYDIASGPPMPLIYGRHSTYALNFKGVHYKTEWVKLPQVASVRQKLECPAVRCHRDGSPFYTLPMIQDPSTGKPAFNVYVDNIFTDCIIILCVHGFPFNPETAEKSEADFVCKAGVYSWDDLTLQGTDRAKKLEEYLLAKFYVDKDEPFLEGKSISYADMIIGGWLQMLKASLEEWKEVPTWHNSRCERFIQALDKYTGIK